MTAPASRSNRSTIKWRAAAAILCCSPQTSASGGAKVAELLQKPRTPVIRLTTSHYRVLFALCALAVLVLSLQSPDVSEPTTGWDKTNHLLAFGTLAVLGIRAWPTRAWHLALALTAYGAAIEALQSLTAYRNPSWADLLADVLGIALGLALSFRAIRA